MADVLQVLVPSLVGVVAPVLLFLQSRASARRESDDRQLERKAEEQRRAQELEARKLDAEQSWHAESIQAKEATKQRERDRYLRFLSAAQEVGLYWKGQEGKTIAHELQYDLRSELAASYEDALLSAPLEVRPKLTEVKEALDGFTRVNIGQAYDSLQLGLMELRDAIRQHLDP